MIQLKRLFIRIILKLKREFNKYLAIIIVYFVYKGMKGNYWLIGASGGRGFVDNSASLYRYILEKHPEIRVFWVINKKSKDVEKLKRIQKAQLLYKDTLKAHIYALLARVHICTHGISDISSFNGNQLSNTLKVNLGHGVTGLKKRINITSSMDKNYDLLIVNSDLEKKFKEAWGVSPEKIVVAGMPRYDDLLLRYNSLKSKSARKILYMPTWREWVLRKSNIKTTNYYKGIFDFVNNSKLNDILKSNNITMNVYIHINMREYFDVFHELNNSQIVLLPQDIDLQNEIASSQLFITDYSSVAWDFLFLNKSVIFYQFDVEDYLKYRGSYIDLRKDLFGPIAYDSEATVRYIEMFVHNNFSEELFMANRERWRNEMFCFVDSNNCKRVTELIIQKVKTNQV